MVFLVGVLAVLALGPLLGIATGAVRGAYGALIGGLTLALRWAWRRQRDGAA
ncbi:MAG: hypothetical protein LCH84_03305 [Gemmatimonadetes bacterium]|nr:hypothetical protein [Gemmatimonadota bacterium]